jgi:pimeloyl-ACP methyl ester carboxylesterase
MTVSSAGLPLVLLPGLAGHAAEFAAVARSWERGPTLSLDPRVTGDLSIGGQADQLAAAARSAGFDRYVVCGHSQGGLVALELAARQPDVVAALAVLDSPVLLPRPLRATLRAFASALGTWAGPALLRTFFRATFHEADSPRLRAEVMTRLAAVPQEAAARVVRATFAYDAGPALGSATVPVTYVRANIPTRLERLPAHVNGVTIDGVGHWVHVHRPHDVAALLDELGARCSPPLDHRGRG